MAHELEMIDGEASMAFAGEDCWHGLGTRVPSDLTPEQMLQAAKLDWSVEKIPLFAEYNGNKMPTGKSALVRDRDGSVLDVISDDWKPTQNIEAFEFFNDFVASGDMEMHTAGSLFDGQVVWALVKVKDDFTILGRDTVESYLLFSNPHKYGSSINIRFTPTRVVCANTLALSLSGKAKTEVRVNHRREFDGERVKEMLGVSHDKLLQYKEMAEFLSTKRYKNEDVVEYFKRIFPSANPEKNPLSRNGKYVMDDLMHSQPGVELGEGTYWQLYNAVTAFTNHHASRTDDNRAASLWYGANRDLNLAALNLAIEMADA
jgi:phage/plasmid-like protein (TIGR03299 family)